MPEPPLKDDELKHLTEQKEQEWRELQHLRVKSLEASLDAKEKELHEYKVKFNKLKEDFKYNLKLLSERHAELDNYDKLIIDLRAALSAREVDLSEAKIRVDELETAVAREAAGRDEMGRHYQQRVREKQAELEDYRRLKDEEVEEDRARLETSKRQLERRVIQLEEEVSTQKQELSFGFEEAIRQREQEFRQQIDNMNSTVLAHELKVKLLTKELEVVKAAAEKSNAEVNEADTQQRTLEKQLKKAQWELHDVTAMKNARISELEGKVEQTEKSMKRMQEDYSLRRAEIDRMLREKDACIQKLKESSNQGALQQADAIRELESALEESKLKVTQLEWAMADQRKDKDSVIDRLKVELNDMRSKYDYHLSESSKDTSAKDLETQALRDSEAKLRSELQQRKSDIERYQKELSSALERQGDLERARAQAELDWRHRYDSVERQQYERSEDLVRGLTRAKDEAQAELTAKEKELKHCGELIKVLTSDRTRAFNLLKEHGIPFDSPIKPDGLSDPPQSADVAELLRQNENLRAVIKHMRKEMEQLGEQIPATEKQREQQAQQQESQRQQQEQHKQEQLLQKVEDETKKVNLIANEYVKSLEKEVQSLKAKLRKVQHDAKHGEKADVGEVAHSVALAAAGENTVVKTHIEALNNTIGTLRKEKTEMMAQLRKQQTRIAHLESSVSQLSKQPLQKQAALEQVQYELSAQQRRHQVEVTGLQARVSDLELQLSETRREADEYYKASIERNLENTSLGQELSKLKIELAEKRPVVNYGAQELMIQQLQDEIQRLHRGQRGEFQDMPSLPEGLGEATGKDRELRQKLRQAARHISQLAREKQQLIEMGNRLRAQLNQAGIRPGDHGPRQPPAGPVSYVPPGGATYQALGQYGKLGHSESFPATSSGPFYPTDSTSSGQSGEVAGLSEKMKNKLIQLEQLHYELTKQKLAAEQADKLAMTGETDALSETSGSVSLGPLGSAAEEDPAATGERSHEQGEEEFRPASILKKSGREQLVKLSPVPEDTIASARRPTGPPTDPIPRPDSALSDSFRPTTAGGGGGGRARSRDAAGGLSTSSVGLASLGGASLGGASLGMSSLGGESLAEIWKMLDEEGVSPRPFTPLHSGDGPFKGLQYPGDAYDRSGSSQSFSVRGSAHQLQAKPRPQTPKAVDQPLRKVPAKKAASKPKIRNYNIKD